VTARSIGEIIAGCRHLLLDFDGPVCSVFAGVGASTVATQLRESLTAAGFDLPTEAQSNDDPLEVFRIAAATSDTAAMTAQQLLTAFEIRAIPTAAPTRGSADLIVTATQTGRTVSIVSNNSGAAIAAYLSDHQLANYVTAIFARDDHDAERMKPDPYRIRAAISILGTEGSECVMIGDSTTDVLAGILAGVSVIGYANKPGKAQDLIDAHADITVTDISEITVEL
jgi:phosphoglycolate phosphatase-like HAD superfamily hydrolase